MTSSDSLTYRCLALTGSFETSSPPPACFGKVAGDFDGQGLSFGALQWNLGQGTLQPLLLEMIAGHPVAFGSHLAELTAILASPRVKQLEWARSLQDARLHVAEPWKSLFAGLGATKEFQAIEVARVENTGLTANVLCQRFGVASERAHALMFDIVTQNGSISDNVEALIRADYLKVGGDEAGRLRAIANRRAEASKKAFVEDVRMRKLCIANGEGTVHGIHYDLEKQFSLTLKPVAA